MSRCWCALKVATRLLISSRSKQAHVSTGVALMRSAVRCGEREHSDLMDAAKAGLVTSSSFNSVRQSRIK
jgi:hypothetical protein